MTETEIMKALAVHFDEDKPCAECPYVDNDELCHILLEKDVQFVIDLINSKNAYIEKLQITNERFAELLAEAYKEIENKEIKARAEAIKEFAERLKGEHFKVPVDAYHSAYVIGDDDLDQIAKEMGVEL